MFPLRLNHWRSNQPVLDRRDHILANFEASLGLLVSEYVRVLGPGLKTLGQPGEAQGKSFVAFEAYLSGLSGIIFVVPVIVASDLPAMSPKRPGAV
jgi:hypothetical protein